MLQLAFKLITNVITYNYRQLLSMHACMHMIDVGQPIISSSLEPFATAHMQRRRQEEKHMHLSFKRSTSFFGDLYLKSYPL